MTSTFGMPALDDAGLMENFSADYTIGGLYPDATVGCLIRDLSENDMSLGYVIRIDKASGTMCVGFPKFGCNKWIKWKNFGHYETVVL
jgi:hypothetical protein